MRFSTITSLAKSTGELLGQRARNKSVGPPVPKPRMNLIGLSGNPARAPIVLASSKANAAADKPARNSLIVGQYSLRTGDQLRPRRPFLSNRAGADIAYQNKAVIYDLLFRASSETMLTIAADPKHLGARIGITAVLHTWGSAMTHHPHVHMIVPGGGISLGGDRWIAARRNFLLPVLVLSRLFRRLMLEKLVAAHAASKLTFFGRHAALADAVRFAEFLAPLKNKRWFVYAKQPFAGPRAVLAYLSRYTHRVAISNGRLLNSDGKTVTFRVKNYRVDGVARNTTMTLDIAEFIRRFLLHVLPKGQHRIRHYGLFANGTRVDNIALARKLIGVTAAEIANAAAEPMHNEEATEAKPATAEPEPHTQTCPCCGSKMRIIEVFQRGQTPRHKASPCPPSIRIDTS